MLISLELELYFKSFPKKDGANLRTKNAKINNATKKVTAIVKF
jgi:hypothetical protein